jgi:hypothetical protein
MQSGFNPTIVPQHNKIPEIKEVNVLRDNEISRAKNSRIINPYAPNIN